MGRAMIINGRISYYCPVEASLNVISGKYKARILYHLDHEGPLRYSQIQRSIPQATPKMLANQLRELESDGLISRKVYPVTPPKTEYSLTEYGMTLHSIVDAMYDWGRNYIERSGAVLLPQNRWADAESTLEEMLEGDVEDGRGNGVIVEERA